jgi:phosphotransacetylase
MALLDTLIPKAKAAGLALVLPEGNDPRVMDAAAKIAQKGIARKVIVLATPDEAKESHAKAGVCFCGLDVEILNWLAAPAEMARRLLL